MKIEELFGKKQMEMPKSSGLNLRDMARNLRYAPDDEIKHINLLMRRAEQHAELSDNLELAQKYAAARQDFARSMHDEKWMGAAMAYQAYTLVGNDPDAFLVAGESKGGPIIGAPKGSQKDARLSPGTDDPSKYMRGGEWEAYREPQGVSSPAGKIAGGVKKGTTKTKNKKTSESVADYMDDDIGLMANPTSAYMQHLGQQVMKSAPRDPHIKGLYDPRGTFWAWNPLGESVHHAEIESVLIEQYGMPDFEDWWEVVEADAATEGFTREVIEPEFDELGGYIPFIMDVNMQTGKPYNPYVAYPSALKQPAVRQALGESLRRALAELHILPGGGPGSSGDLVPRHRDATTLNMVKDTTTPTRERTPMANNKAPVKQAMAKVKKSLTDTPGNTKPVNESVPKSLRREYDADYTLRDDQDKEDLGEARVRQGVIELLAVRNDFAEDFNGHVMSRLMSTIVNDADLANANLAIQLDDPSDIQHKRFMERFGFRETQNGIMKRNAGSIRPPSVPTARL